MVVAFDDTLHCPTRRGLYLGYCVLRLRGILVESPRSQAELGDRKARVIQLREEASRPAFQAQIENCRTLIDYFSAESTTPIVSRAKGGYTEPTLEIRQVEAAPDNFVPLKKKGEEEGAYFIGRKGKNEGKKDPKVSLSLRHCPVHLMSMFRLVHSLFSTHSLSRRHLPKWIWLVW
jgi:hypothetical protein